MRANQEKMDDGQEKMRARVGSLISWMDAHHAKTETNHEELIASMKASHESIEVMEAYPEIKEVDPEEMKSVAVHEEVPKEEAAVKSFGAPKKWHRGRHLTAGS
jgi:hypothetical protein